MIIQDSDQISCLESVAMVSELRDWKLSLKGQSMLNNHVLGCISCQIARVQFNALFDALDEILGNSSHK